MLSRPRKVKKEKPQAADFFTKVATETKNEAESRPQDILLAEDDFVTEDDEDDIVDIPQSMLR